MFDQYDPLMTVSETCEALMVGKNTVYDLIQSNKIDGFRTGRVWKITRESLESFVRKEAGLITL